MKAVKITLLLVAVLLLTVSGVQSDAIAKEENPTYQKSKPNYNLLACDKKKIKVQSQG